MIRCDQTTRIFRSGTTVPVRLLQEALVNFVFKQISQFRSFGKCVWTLCIPEPGSTFCSRLHWQVHEKNLEVPRYPGSGFHRNALTGTTFIDQILSDLLQPIRQIHVVVSLRISSREELESSRCSGFLSTTSLLFDFIMPRVSPYGSSLVLPLQSGTGFSVYRGLCAQVTRNSSLILSLLEEVGDAPLERNSLPAINQGVRMAQ